MSNRKPAVVLSEDGKQLTVAGPQFGASHTFEVVERVPIGYSIWNIGKNMADGYLPLCRLAAVQPFPGGRNIEPDTLKAIECEGAQVILSAIGWGPETPGQMERYIKKHENNPHRQLEVNRMKKALPYLKKIKFS